jgi:hypothetical protein
MILSYAVLVASQDMLLVVMKSSYCAKRSIKVSVLRNRVLTVRIPVYGS